MKGFEESFGGSTLVSSKIGDSRQSGAFADDDRSSESEEDEDRELEAAAETLKSNGGKGKKKKKIAKDGSQNKGCGQEACCVIF